MSTSGDDPVSTYFMGSEVLAQAWAGQGELLIAAQVLRTALEKEPFLMYQSVLVGPSGDSPLWGTLGVSNAMMCYGDLDSTVAYRLSMNPLSSSSRIRLSS